MTFNEPGCQIKTLPEATPETKVYSFQVEDFHTFYVGKNGLLVHNAMLKPTTN